MDNNKTVTAPKPKTIDMRKDEPELLKWFRKWVKSHRYINQAMAKSGFNYRTIKNVAKDGICAPDTIDRIKELQKQKAA